MPLTLSNPFCRASLLILVAATAMAAGAQAYTPPPPPLTAAPCVPTKKDPCTPVTQPPAAASAFPFPGEPGSTPSNQTQPAPAAPGAQPSFPFPGEAPAAPPAEPGESSSSSSSSSSSNAAAPTDDTPAAPVKEEPAGSTRFARKHLPKVEDSDGRESKDLEVSKYYTSTGNFQAAYLRAKDAVATVPDDPAAHFLLAQTAQKLNKNEEAILEYATMIKLEPDGENVPAASKALATLTGAKPKK